MLLRIGLSQGGREQENVSFLSQYFFSSLTGMEAQEYRFARQAAMTLRRARKSSCLSLLLVAQDCDLSPRQTSGANAWCWHCRATARVRQMVTSSPHCQIDAFRAPRRSTSMPDGCFRRKPKSESPAGWMLSVKAHRGKRAKYACFTCFAAIAHEVSIAREARICYTHGKRSSQR